MRERACLRLRPYRAGDEDAFTPRRDFADDQAATGWTWGRPPGRTWTLCRGHEVLGIGGVVERGEWLEAWACLSDLPRRDWPAAMGCARAALDFAFRTYRPGFGVFATARADNPGAVRVLRRLGFMWQANVGDARTPGVLYARMIRGS